MVDPAALAMFEPFRALGPGAREALAARALVRKFQSGQHLWRAGDESRGLYLILDGRVRIVSDAGARQHVVHVEGKGATLGEVPLFSGAGYPATAVAAEATVCLVLDRRSLRSVMVVHPDLAWALLERLAGRVRLLVDRLSVRTGDPMQARLAAYVLSQPATREGTITLGDTQQAIAEELGTVREVVVRQLARLLKSGLLERRGRGQYIVKDAAALSLLAERGPWRRTARRRR